MIIEMFGPAGAGKTTLARSVAQALRGKGREVRLVSSSRPTETNSMVRGASGSSPFVSVVTAPLRRALKVASAVPALMGSGDPDKVDAKLLALFPQGHLLSMLRSRRYLAILLKHWSVAVANPDRVTIFDQAFLSSVCNLSMSSSRGQAADIEHAMSFVPRPDLLVVLKPHQDVLKARLTERLARQSALERWLELDLATTLRQVDEVSRLGAFAERLGWRSLSLNSTVWSDLDGAVSEIVLRAAAPAAEHHAALTCVVGSVGGQRSRNVRSR